MNNSLSLSLSRSVDKIMSAPATYFLSYQIWILRATGKTHNLLRASDDFDCCHPRCGEFVRVKFECKFHSAKSTVQSCWICLFSSVSSRFVATQSELQLPKRKSKCSQYTFSYHWLALTRAIASPQWRMHAFHSEISASMRSKKKAIKKNNIRMDGKSDNKNQGKKCSRRRQEYEDWGLRIAFFFVIRVSSLKFSISSNNWILQFILPNRIRISERRRRRSAKQKTTDRKLQHIFSDLFSYLRFG